MLISSSLLKTLIVFSFLFICERQRLKEREIEWKKVCVCVCVCVLYDIVFVCNHLLVCFNETFNWELIRHLLRNESGKQCMCDIVFFSLSLSIYLICCSYCFMTLLDSVEGCYWSKICSVFFFVFCVLLQYEVKEILQNII